MNILIHTYPCQLTNLYSLRLLGSIDLLQFALEKDEGCLVSQ